MLTDFLSQPLHFFLAAVIAYLLGSLNFSIIISRTMMGVDIRNFGSGNAGTTNTLRTLGAKAAVFTFIGDVLKAVLAILFARAVAGENAAIVAGFFCVVGHVFPIYFKFKGGKGVLTSAAVVFMLNWMCLAILLLVFIVAVVFSKRVSAGSIIAALTFPMVAYATDYSNREFFIFSLLIMIYVLFMHRTNLVRILNDEEPKISFRKKKRAIEEETQEEQGKEVNGVNG